MKKCFLRRRLAGFLVFVMCMSMSGVGVMAETVATVDLGTFMVTANGRDPGGGDNPGGNEEPGGNGNSGENENPGENEGSGYKTSSGNRGESGDGSDSGSENGSGNNTESGNRSGSENSTESGNEAGGNVSDDGIAQGSEDSDIITESRTAVATKTKWRITPSFNVVRVASSDKRAIKVSKKKDKSRSSGGNKWYGGFLRVKKPGVVTITLEGASGEKEEYLIYAENPVIKKNALVVNDVKTVSVDSYLSGITYLKPTSVESKKPEIATVSADGSISVLANGKSRLTLKFGKRKVKGNIKAMLPAFAKKRYVLKDKSVKLTMKNVSNNSAVEYRSSDVSVVKMNKDGYAAPVAKGMATVYGKSGNVTAECEVVVKGLYGRL